MSQPSGAAPNKAHTSFKLVVRPTGEEPVFRRFQAPADIDFPTFAERVAAVLGCSPDAVCVSYTDPDGDVVDVTTAWEWPEAMCQQVRASLRRGEDAPVVFDIKVLGGPDGPRPISRSSATRRVGPHEATPGTAAAIPSAMAAHEDGVCEDAEVVDEEASALNSSTATADFDDVMEPADNVREEDRAVLALLSELCGGDVVELMRAGALGPEVSAFIRRRVDMAAGTAAIDIEHGDIRRFTMQTTTRLLDSHDYNRAALLLRLASVAYPTHITFRYNYACALALGGGETAAAVAALRSAVELGYDNFDYLHADPDLEKIRGSADYQQLLVDLVGAPVARLLEICPAATVSRVREVLTLFEMDVHAAGMVLLDEHTR